MCRIVLGGSELFTVRCPKLGSKCSQIDIEELGFWHLCRTLFGDFILLHFCYASFQSREKIVLWMTYLATAIMAGIAKLCQEIMLDLFSFWEAHFLFVCTWILKNQVGKFKFDQLDFLVFKNKFWNWFLQTTQAVKIKFEIDTNMIGHKRSMTLIFTIVRNICESWLSQKVIF